MSGLGKSGTVVMDADGIIGGWDVDGYTATSSESNDEGLSVNGTNNVIGDPFILIPQDLATNNVTLTVVCKSGLTLEATIASGKWKAGCTNIYTLGYGTASDYLFNAIDEEGQVIYTPTLVMSNTSTDSDQQKVLISNFR